MAGWRRAYGNAATLLLVLALVGMSVLPPSWYWVTCAVAGSACFVMSIFARRDGNWRDSLALLMIGVGLVVSVWGPWVPLFGAVAAIITNRRLLSLRPLMRASVAGLAAVICLASIVGILVWASLRNGLTFYFLPDALISAGEWLLPLALVLAALCNATYEELLWRDLLVTKWDFFPVVFLSIAFGLAHWNSIPGGLLGVAMSTVFALAMYWLRRASGGSLGACIAVHVIVDIVALYVVFL